MRQLNLRCLIASALLCLPGQVSVAQPLDGAGIAAIRSGSVEETGDFVGTGFHIGNGWFATAKHVIEDVKEKAGGDWHIVLASKSADGNKIKVYRSEVCQPNLDFCFFRVDPTDARLNDLQFGKAFQPDCDVPPKQEVEMRGFSVESDFLNVPEPTQVQSKAASFQADDDGTKYPSVIVTGAPASPGMSGSPVMKFGTRNVIGLHTGYSSTTHSQVVSPFYNIAGPVMIDGDQVFDCGMALDQPPGPRAQAKLTLLTVNTDGPIKINTKNTSAVVALVPEFAACSPVDDITEMNSFQFQVDPPDYILFLLSDESKRTVQFGDVIGELIPAKNMWNVDIPWEWGYRGFLNCYASVQDEYGIVDLAEFSMAFRIGGGRLVLSVLPYQQLDADEGDRDSRIFTALHELDGLELVPADQNSGQ